MHRHVRQSVDEKDMEEIVQVVRSYGYDFESMPETSDKHRRIARVLGHNVNNPAGTEVDDEATRDIGHENTRPELATPGKFVPNKKRKREPEQATRREKPSNGGAKDASCDNERTPPNQQVGIGIRLNNKQDTITSLTQTDNCWDLDHCSDPVRLSQIHPQASESSSELALDQSAPPHVREVFDPNLPLSLSKAPDSTSFPLSQALQPSYHDTQLADIEWPDTDHVFDSAHSYTMSVEDADDWGSTVWWDPSDLFDFDIDASGLRSSVT